MKWYCYSNAGGIDEVVKRKHQCSETFDTITDIINYFELGKNDLKFKNCKVVFSWYDERLKRDVFSLLGDYRYNNKTYKQQHIRWIIIY